MTDFTEDLPRNFRIEKEYQEDYQRLKEEGLFEDIEMYEIFLLSMSLGWYNQVREPLEDPYPLINARTIGEKKFWTVVSVAVSEEGMNILDDFTEIRNIADEYANGGFPILLQKVESGQPGSELKRFQKLLMDAAKE